MQTDSEMRKLIQMGRNTQVTCGLRDSTEFIITKLYQPLSNT